MKAKMHGGPIDGLIINIEMITPFIQVADGDNNPIGNYEYLAGQEIITAKKPKREFDVEYIFRKGLKLHNES